MSGRNSEMHMHIPALSCTVRSINLYVAVQEGTSQIHYCLCGAMRLILQMKSSGENV